MLNVQAQSESKIDSRTPKTPKSYMYNVPPIYLVCGQEISRGEQGAYVLRDPQVIVDTPKSTCFERVTFWENIITGFCVIRVYFRKGRFKVYEYQGFDQTKVHFKLLQSITKIGGSVGNAYNIMIKQNSYYQPAFRIA
jgi:hypothetical protein